MRVIDGKRCENWIDPRAEKFVQVVLLGWHELLPAQHLDALVGEGGEDVRPEGGGLALHESAALGVDPSQLLAWGAAGAGLNGQASGEPAPQSSDPDHEELVEIIGEDGEKPDPFEQWDGGVLGELEHPLVELQPALLTIKEAVVGQFGLLHFDLLGHGSDGDRLCGHSLRMTAPGERGETRLRCLTWSNRPETRRHQPETGRHQPGKGTVGRIDASSNLPTVIRRRVIVYGMVQGVFYRDTCRSIAWQQGVAGWVRNRPDGTVEAVFEGEQDAVDRMVAWASHGPRHAAVERIETLAEEPEGFTDFSIR